MTDINGKPELHFKERILNGKPPVVIRTEIQELLNSPNVLMRNRGEMMEIELRDMLVENRKFRKIIWNARELLLYVQEKISPPSPFKEKVDAWLYEYIML